ncbi:probable DNA double-strand break repair Rad50 ATPase isoform X2 [Gallus gallus]|uniref:probable DNA double-strand break repair Rad50 ATPase isoform X2 n=1 Tax=Gallus gallus TaxID=9031 RepID=UPI001AE534D6|nr:probable DNA double-strand break repair Rad50 ATPase isoform X2 [Gallus gallus]
MLRPEPGTVALPPSAVALAAIHRLQSLEKHVKNEDCAFSEEIVQHLEDTIAAIEKLEEMRRNTIECLEEETIKNSKLRFRMRNLPGEIAAEMTALVAASREAGAAKMNQLQSALKNIACEIELLDEKQTLCERQNAALCEEQKRLQIQHKERVDLLNERMATKINTNLLLLETDRKTRAIEREIIRAKAALEELQEKIAEKMSQLEKQMEECDGKNREMKKLLDAQKEKTSAKKHAFENLNIKLLDLQHLISLNSTAIRNEEILVTKLKEKREHLEKKMDLKKVDVATALEKKNQIDSELLLLQSKIAQEKEDFDQELGKANEYLQNAECLNNKLKLENKAVYQKFEQALEEEKHWARRRDEMDAKSRRLSVHLDEKLEFLENLVMKTNDLEQETEHLEDSLLISKESNAKELASLEQKLKAENKMRVMLQWKLLYLAKQSKLFFLEEEDISRRVNERIEAGEKRHAELLLETKKLEKELLQSERQVKVLTEEAIKRRNDYRSYNEDFTNKMKYLEDDIKIASEKLLKIEHELKVSRLTLEETQKEREEKHTEYEELRKSFLKKKDEELQIRRAIQKSIKTTGMLKEEILELRKQLRIKRDAAVRQLKHQTESMKLLERDIYEINRKLDIVNTENCRFKVFNTQMKEDIFAMNAEAEGHQSAIVRIQHDLAVLRGFLLERWSEDSSAQKEFLENEQEILNAVTALLRKIQHREEKIGDINSRLRSSLEGLDSLFEKKSRMDDEESDAVKNK